MATRKKVEIFSAGCSACNETIEIVRRIPTTHEVVVHDMNKSEIAARAKEYGIHRVPAVVIDGELASCCMNRGPEEKVLEAALA